ncbi:BTB/POZ domain-containing protein 17-like [Arctopsyche grandis]|uniref:BTB/POZ domain-containing protein 17-like n=1 Tax=Arctopsyche grandis TaxID=121162 RepID=UPI00406D9B57
MNEMKHKNTSEIPHHSKKPTAETAAPSTSAFVEVDNSTSVLIKIATLYADQLMSDINLVVGGKSYPAHRLILCATSEVFQVMLMNREWSEWRESAIELKETPQCSEVFPLFLRYFYTGQIRISQETVLPILSLADKYNIKDLVELCLTYMSRHLANAVQQGQLVSWLQYTMACGHSDVAKECQNFVKWNLETLARTSDFGNFEPEVLISLLQQNDLVVYNEMNLYIFVTRWLEHQRSQLMNAEGQDFSEADVEAHLHDLVYATISHIRFPMMTPRQLAELLLNPFTQIYKEFLVERMAIGMSYHSGHNNRVKEIFSTEEGKLLFTPRLYTEDKWSSVLTIEDFHSLPCYHTRTFVFSSHTSQAEHAGDRTCEWVVDLYPKGVWFHKAFLICWQGKYEVPEVVLRTVRLAVTCRDPPKVPYKTFGREPHMRVKIGILISGVQWGIEHVSAVKERIFHFSASQRVLNIDNVLDFDELNTPIYSPPSSQQQPQTSSRSSSWPKYSKCYCQCGKYFGVSSQQSRSKTCGMCSAPEPPINLIGKNRDQLTIQIVIIPLTDVCSVTSPDFGFK